MCPTAWSRSKIAWVSTYFRPSARTGSRRTTPICAAANRKRLEGARHRGFKCDKFPRIGDIHEKLRRGPGLTGLSWCFVTDCPGKAELCDQRRHARRADTAVARAGD